MATTYTRYVDYISGNNGNGGTDPNTDAWASMTQVFGAGWAGIGTIAGDTVIA